MSTTRNTLPPSLMSSPVWSSTTSRNPLLSAGKPSAQKTSENVAPPRGRVEARSSTTTVDLPSGVWPVMTRRTGGGAGVVVVGASGMCEAGELLAGEH